MALDASRNIIGGKKKGFGKKKKKRFSIDDFVGNESQND
jgi:hypothetical protein